MDMNALVQNASATLMAVGWKLVGAVALWLIGRWLIALALRLVGRALASQHFDVTLARYLQTALRIVLNVALTSLEWRGPLHHAKLTALHSLFAARSAPFAPAHISPTPPWPAVAALRRSPLAWAHSRARSPASLQV
jgi:hypothetical protein